MKQTICEIYLNPSEHCNGVYHSGQKLSGNIVLTFYEKQSVDSIVIQILGIGKCEWTEQRRIFQNDEIYMKSEIKISEPFEGKVFFTINYLSFSGRFHIMYIFRHCNSSNGRLHIPIRNKFAREPTNIM